MRLLFDATDRLYRTTKKNFHVVECENCRLVRLHPWPSADELRHYYPDHYWFSPGRDTASRLEETYRRFVLRDHLAFVMRAAEDAGEGVVLDVGCGGGLLLGMLQEQGLRVAGLDNSEIAASAARTSNGVSVVCGDLSCAPLRPGSFSVVTMFHVVEHLPDAACYLRVAHELLSPDGRVVVQVPNASSWQFLLLGPHWNGIDVPRHLVDYRESDLQALLERGGFEVVRRKNFSLRDNPAGLASSLAPELDPMARRVRKIRESSAAKLAKDFVYFALVLAALPFTMLEALCGAGSTIMLEARKKA
jgi:SAM-dependent methyltransferase